MISCFDDEKSSVFFLILTGEADLGTIARVMASLQNNPFFSSESFAVKQGYNDVVLF